MIGVTPAVPALGTAQVVLLIIAAMTLFGVLVTALLKRGSDEKQLAFEKHKLSAEQRKDAMDDIETALEAMGTVVMVLADPKAREDESRRARVALQKIAVTHRHLSEDRSFRALRIALASPSDENLRQAERLWPNVERMVVEKWPVPPS